MNKKRRFDFGLVLTIVVGVLGLPAVMMLVFYADAIDKFFTGVARAILLR